MIPGLALQVVSLVVFMALCGDYMGRVRQDRKRQNAEGPGRGPSLLTVQRPPLPLQLVFHSASFKYSYYATLSRNHLISGVIKITIGMAFT